MGKMGGLGPELPRNLQDTWDNRAIKGGARFDCAGFFGSQCGFASSSRYRNGVIKCVHLVDAVERRFCSHMAHIDKVKMS